MFCESCRTRLEMGALICANCGAPVQGSLEATSAAAPRVAAQDFVLSGPQCPAHAGMPLVGKCPRCRRDVCIRCAPDAAMDRFTCTECEGLSAAHQLAPDDARCFLHPEARANFICSRCGTFGCPNCADGGPAGLCVRCAPSVGTPASRGSRFVANLVDNLVIILPIFGLAFAGVLVDENAAGEENAIAGVLALIMLGAMLIGAIGQLVAQLYWGQSVGKRLLGIKVVRTNGEPISIWRLLFLRNLLINVVAQFCGLVSLIDAVMIFSENRRCLHDHMADSVVVEVEKG